MDTWFTIPGLTAGTTRSVPGSAVLAGRLAVNDAERDPGEFPAGDNVYGRLPYVLARTAPARTNDERASLNGAGVIVTRPGLLGGPLVIYGARSLDRTLEWQQASAGRLRMALEADARVATERTIQFASVDGQGLKLSDWNGALRAVCARYYDAGRPVRRDPRRRLRRRRQRRREPAVRAGAGHRPRSHRGQASARSPSGPGST